MRVQVRLRAFDPGCLTEARLALSGPGRKWVGIPTRKRLFTILRSPHVHKKALDQFYFKEYHSLCTISNMKREDFLVCFSLSGVSCSFQVLTSTQFPRIF